MHLKSLKIFCDIVARRSFSRAATVNGVSQSNASQAVHHLEERLGVQLIDRSKRPFVLTPEGEKYYEGVRPMLQKYYTLEEEIRTLHEIAAGRLAVASIYSVGLNHMGQFMKKFISAHPHIDLRLDYLHPDRVYDLVKNGTADFGLVSYPKESKEIKVILWRTESLVLVTSPAHLFARKKKISLESLQGEKFVALQTELRIREEIDHALALHQVQVDVQCEFDNIEMIKRAIEAETGISILPAPTVQREVEAKTLISIPLIGQQMTRPLGIIHRRDMSMNDAAQAFIDLLTSENKTSAKAQTASQPNKPSTNSKTNPEKVPIKEEPKAQTSKAKRMTPASLGEELNNRPIAPADSSLAIRNPR